MSPSRRWFNLRATRAAALGLVSGLVLLLAGDSGVRSAANSGIDPLEILNLQVKPNVFIVFDTSGSMRAPNDQFRNLGGDDPMSRLFQAKDALKQVLQANATRVNFGFGTYNIRNNDKVLNFPSICDGFSCDVAGKSAGGPLLYVSNSANGAIWTGIATNFFGSTDVPPPAPIQSAPYTGIAGAEVFNSFTAVSRNFTDLTACPAATPDCRRYLLSRLLRDGVVYRWNTNTGALVSANAFVCPLPPAGLFPQDPNVTGLVTESDLRRPCFAMDSGAGGTGRAIFWYSSGLWENTVPGDTCNGAALLNAVVACDQDAAPTIVSNYLKPELPVDGSCVPTPAGFPCRVPATTGNVAGTVVLGNNFSGANANIELGIIAAQSTPLAASLDFVNSSFATVFPNQVAGQKNFVLLLTDGDDTCVSGSDQDSDGDFDDDDRAILAAKSAQQLYSTNATETIVVAFTTDVNQARADKIARAGSGGTVQANGNVDCLTAGVPCRAAYTASNAKDLATVLNAAIQQTVNIGEFSDQQSITESIFELVSHVPVDDPVTTAVEDFSFPLDPQDPLERFATSVPVILQSTFEMPDFKGHLKAFRNRADPDIDDVGPQTDPGDPNPPPTCELAGDTTVGTNTCKLWDAAEKLCQRVTGSPTCAAPAWPRAGGTAFFSDLHGGAFSSLPRNVGSSTALIKRRIYTTIQNGVNPRYTPTNLASADVNPANNVQSPATWTQQVAMWPPDTSNGTVAPLSANSQGSLDVVLGITYPQLGTALAKFQQLQTDFKACVGSNLPSGCTSNNDTTKYETARKEAREMILAYLAGAQFAKDASGNPTREAASKNILYRARSWIMAESTLAAPAVIPPALQGDPSQEVDEYTVYRDGPTNAAGGKINAIAAGFGLRNPDVDAVIPDVNLKPVMTVVYHTTNEILHAFRAGPCAACVPAETGGEELWGFVPFDLLGKLKDRMKPQTRANHTYMLASPVRFADVFVRGAFSRSILGVTVSGDGVWRKLAIFGRGAGGKSLTGIDVTVPGPFTISALKTYPPVVVWNRGNPDTNDGNCKSGTAGCTAAANSYNNTVSGAAGASDYNAYLKMGETWSVPALVFVTADNNQTPRRRVEFAAYAGSGFSDVTTEGKTFYALDALSGDVIASHDIPNRASPPAGIPNHALVASPAAYQPDLLTAAFLGQPRNPATEKGTLVFFPDIHSRVWRFVTDTPTTVAPTLFVDLSVTDGEQPVGNAIGLAAANSDGSGIQPHLYLEAGNDSRVPAPAASPFFRMFGFRDVSGTAGSLFSRDFPSGFRGTVQPTVSFNQPDPSLSANDRRLRVFFAGTRFNPAISSCASSFDSILFALTGVSGGAAYDLAAGGGAEESLTMTGQRVSALQITGEQLVVDMGLGAQNPPPPPAPPKVVTSTGGQKVVRNDTRNVPEAVPFRLGTSVCR